MDLVETLNRTLKLAMDEGRVGSHDEATALFETFRLRVHVAAGFSVVPAAEAAVLTLLNASPRTFLGGVELVGPLDELFTMAWFNGKRLGEVAEGFGVATAVDDSSHPPTIYVGHDVAQGGSFSLGISTQPDGFILSPDATVSGSQDSPVEAGVAAAGAALNEAFQFVYRKAPLAGQREVRWKFPSGTNAAPVGSLWLIGLGHLGQAFLWTAALAGRGRLPNAVRLTDYDVVSWSSLSTGLMVTPEDVGRKKVDVVANQMEALGIQVQRHYERLDLDVGLASSVHELAVVAVDNIALRRSLDRLRAKRVLEAGIGDGADGFTRIQVHAFPGSRKARDIWIGDDARAARAVDLSLPAYRALLATSGDECGTTLVAGRSIATPFAGAFAGAVLSMLSTKQCGNLFSWSYDLNCL
jgi:hypothetical protein